MNNPIKNEYGWNFKTISAILGVITIILLYTVATNQTISLEEMQENGIRSEEQNICKQEIKEMNKELERKTEVTKQCLADRQEESLQFNLTINELTNTIENGYSDINSTLEKINQDLNDYFSDCNC